MGKTEVILTKETIWKKNLYAMWTSQFLVNMGFGLAMSFIPYFLEEIATLTENQLSLYTGLSSTIPSAAMAVAAPFWGKMSDRYGRKNMLVRALIFGSITLILIGSSKSVLFFLFARAFQGFFTGSVPASMALISANTPDKEMTKALGVMTSSNFLGYAMGPLLGGFICEWIGYSGCFYVGSVVNTIGLLIVVFMIKEIPGTYGKELVEQQKLKKAAGEKTGVLTTGIIMILVTMLCMRLARTVFGPFLAIFVREVLGTMDGATKMIGIINLVTCVATGVSSITLARLGDKYDKFKYAGLLTVGALVVSLLMGLPVSIWVFIAFYGMFYFLVGGIEPVLTSAASEIVDAGSRGVLFGLLSTCSSLGMMFSPMLGSVVSVVFGVRQIIFVIPMFIFLELIATLVMINYAKKKRLENAE
ncbi:MAG: MFS transporter [Firmicutes bacterium]|nr:MFS transporter [Bacillota bacterium]